MRHSPDERTELTTRIHRGRSLAQTATRARILLHADRASGQRAMTDVAIAEAVGTSVSTVQRTRRAYVTQG